MLVAIAVLIVSIALLMFYLQARCERILRREFDGEFFHGLANANRLSFPFVRKAVEEFDLPVDYWRFRMSLKCDFLALTYLLKYAGSAKGCLSKEVRFLTWYFRTLVLKLIITHWLGLGERVAVLKLASILEYFANVLGERGERLAWKAEIDVMVEDNGTVFLVYPLSDAAQEWFDMNMFSSTQRLGDIQFVEPRHLDGLVGAMLDSGLSMTLTNSRRKAREKGTMSASR